jgi:hypothetical protein
VGKDARQTKRSHINLFLPRGAGAVRKGHKSLLGVMPRLP